MIIENMQTFNKSKKGNYIALGSFDGLHLGHISLIEKAVKLAKENDGYSVVYTFINHPRKFMNPDADIKLLLNNQDKVNILEQYNVDILYQEKFDNTFMKNTPEQFVEYLCEKFNVKGIIVGFNHKFGYKNQGDINLLQNLSSTYNYKLYVMEPYKYKNEPVSSTRIRRDIKNGFVENAANMLGRPHILTGNVVKGKQIGRQIGYPTANIAYEDEAVLPATGVYYTNVLVNDKIYKGMTNIGNNPTVNGKELTIETYILDFSGSIYDTSIKLFFIKKIREQIRFEGINALKNQLQNDQKYIEKEELSVIAKNIYNIGVI